MPFLEAVKLTEGMKQKIELLSNVLPHEIQQERFLGHLQELVQDLREDCMSRTCRASKTLQLGSGGQQTFTVNG